MLTCLTSAYSPIWEKTFGVEWDLKSPTRKATDRRNLLVELDVLSALSFGIAVEELCAIYRTQFTVLQDYERNEHYDANGRKVPSVVSNLYRKHREKLALEDRQWTHPQSGVTYTYEFPFRQFDREQDMREAYARFERELEEGAAG